ncbi:Predicted ABC-type ATPase [Thermomonospora echinospora]|uniref:Predicted ABC-type ATPase n=1 Tax=Thermomonospora echinospora TaxID=1992 RepID=A0A1H6A7K0_9ACTN|nr:AAA family ATPase [Thermomonospora echinospora]SEG44723.1 Predicted ABC-type ATPase [Thermomonospora echinospora]
MSVLTVVVGPPCSGKTTYVQAHAQDGDIVIDLDLIAQALGSPVTHGHADAITRTAQAARRAAITTAIRQHHRGARVWIVECDPSRQRRAEYHRAGARFVPMQASRAELHRRAADRPPHWHTLIDQQLARQSPQTHDRDARTTRTGRW